MRISIFEIDPGWVPDPKNYEVLLDGERIDNCVTADDRCGLVYVLDGNPAGAYTSAAAW